MNKTVTDFFLGGYIYRYTPRRYAPAYSIVRDANIVLAKSLPYFAARNLATLAIGLVVIIHLKLQKSI